MGDSVPDTMHPPVTVLSTPRTETSLSGDQCFFELTTIPPEFSSFRIVAPYGLRLNRLKGNATALVALARRIGVVLHRMERDGTEFNHATRPIIDGIQTVLGAWKRNI
ncbi:hypothetical protein [Yoonia sp.]|uniref:hypothetical protein n=1 Tax=Yoonia sp. TaxID=2212373 RepID=UPI0039765EFA